MARPLLEVKGLKTYFFTDEGVVKAVDGIDFHINKGEIFGLVGESGCGKSVTALSLLRVVPSPPGRIIDGKVMFEGKDLLKISEKEMRRIRGAKISMIFQDPHSSLNPVFRIGDQIAEAIQLHQKVGEKEVPSRVMRALDLVRIPDPKDRMYQYPHQFSGGMKQRTMIAMMLACNPALLIADEPTTAVDVTIQIQILELLRELRRKQGASIMIITHNLGVIAEVCDRVAVMYAGNIVEQADMASLFGKPKHPYTHALLGTFPSARIKRGELMVIPGFVPSLVDPPSGCKFHPRCPHAKPICMREMPCVVEVDSGHIVRCHLYNGGKR
jgi:peptide/nickel transport system ATP-binding protein/oligopeptide transport system ATP-binding protein